MIKLHNLNKYFNKNKSNEIHVINDISLTLPQTGLVVLLGPSGSGKTTLLNVLGGLDKIQNGLIDFDGQQIQGYKSRTWDHIRNEHIGYIFQNYNLLHNQSVYDNIALSLRMVGINDKDEIDKRIDYLLENVGMINYRRRKAANLSGGQQQRVAIARALAKNPKVIIADEPTGNLDSKNTFDIMNILRTISKTKLVVLVTHEENIADLYADRIIRLKDGQIVSDQENQSIGGVDVQLETDIYLKDLTQITSYDKDNTSYEVYSDEITDTNFDVKLIVKNKTLYVQVDSNQFTRVNLLDKESEVQVYDSHFVGQEIEEFSQTEFDLNNIIDDTKKTDQRSVIPTKEAVRLGFNQFRGMTKIKFFQHTLFFLNAVVVGIALALLFNAYTVDNLDFMTIPVDTVYMDRVDHTFNDLLEYENETGVGYLNMAGKVELEVQLPKVYQTRGNSMTFNYSPIPIEYFDESNLVSGRTVQNQNEVIVSEHYLDSLLTNTLFASLGIQTHKDFMELKMTYTIDGFEGKETVEVIIVGVAALDDPVFYAKEETIWQIKSGIGVYELYEDDITLVNGAKSEVYGKMLVKENNLLPVDLTEIEKAIFNQEFVAEAIYTSTEDIPDILVPLDDLRHAKFDQEFPDRGGTVSFYANDREQAEQVFKDAEFMTAIPYDDNRAEFMEVKLLRSIPYIMFAGVFLGAAFLGTFFIMRSSLLSRIYEISVYRALGAPKSDLRRVFLIETGILTVFTSFIGYAAISYVLVQIQIATDGYPGFELVRVSPLSFVAGLGIIALVNIFSGILPISNLLTKTPAEIISKYDF